MTVRNTFYLQVSWKHGIITLVKFAESWEMSRPLNYVWLILAVTLIPSPSMAAVYLNCADLGNGVIELSYDFSEEPVRVRAFALDISVSNGIITSVGNFSPHYWIYPGTIEIVLDPWGEVVDLGIPIAPSSEPGTLGGLGTSGMTIEMGSLYAGEANAPSPTGVLLTFTISAACNITIEENVIRGGVVFEDPEHNAPVYSPGLQGALPPEPEEYGGGSGTAADPFLIFNPEQFNTIALNPGDMYNHFKLMADINLGCYTGTQFNIIGTYYGCAFRGTFDGNGRKIHNFTYSFPEANFVGLFGYVDGSTTEIKDLDLINPNVNAGTGRNAGSLVGYLRRGTVSRCSAREAASPAVTVWAALSDATTWPRWETALQALMFSEMKTSVVWWGGLMSNFQTAIQPAAFHNTPTLSAGWLDLITAISWLLSGILRPVTSRTA